MNLPSAKSAQSGTLKTESPLRDLEAIIRSRMPFVAIESNEEPQIVRLVRQIGQQLQVKAYRWTVTEGLQAFEPADQPQDSILKSQEILKYSKSSASHCLFVLLDFHPYLEDAVHVRLLKDIALACGKHLSTVVLVGCALPIPQELKPYTALAEATQGFSGSEIEQAIVSAMYTAHAQGRTVSQADLLAEMKQTRPLSVVMSEKVDEIRAWAATRMVPCD